MTAFSMPGPSAAATPARGVTAGRQEDVVIRISTASTQPLDSPRPYRREADGHDDNGNKETIASVARAP